MNFIKKSGRSKTMMLVMVLLVLASSITMGFRKILSNNVNLIINGETKKVVTFAKTVGEFLETENIEVKNSEEVIPGEDEKITNDMDIVISSPKSYQIVDGNETRITKSLGLTVKDVLIHQNIKLGGYDVVTPALNEKTTPGMTITIERVEKEIFDQEVSVPFEVKKEEDDTLYKGETKIVQKGVEGLKAETVQNTFVNGNHVSVDVLKSEMVKEPVTEIQKVGIKKTPAQAAMGDRKVKKVITMEATAYDPSAGSKTAMGTRARVGAVAVDPRVIPLGSKLYIESMDGYSSYGYATAEDTGGAIKGNRIDLFYSSNSEALRFGRRNVRVYVLD